MAKKKVTETFWKKHWWKIALGILALVSSLSTCKCVRTEERSRELSKAVSTLSETNEKQRRTIDEWANEDITELVYDENGNVIGKKVTKKTSGKNTKEDVDKTTVARLTELTLENETLKKKLSITPGLPRFSIGATSDFVEWKSIKSGSGTVRVINVFGVQAWGGVQYSFDEKKVRPRVELKF